MYNTPSPEFPADLDAFQQMTCAEQCRPNTYHDRTHYPTRFDPSTATVNPDDEFVESLRSIRATGSSPDQDYLDRVSDSTKSEAVVADTILRSRKSWKTVKGRAEPVWPPELEKALIQGVFLH